MGLLRSRRGSMGIRQYCMCVRISTKGSRREVISYANYLLFLRMFLLMELASRGP